MPDSTPFSPSDRLIVQRYAPDHQLGAHVHVRPSFTILMEGAYEEGIRGRWQQHQPGDMLYCPPNEPHAQRFGLQEARKILIFPTLSALAYLQDRGVALAQAPSASLGHRLLPLGRRLQRETQAGDAFSALVCDSLVLDALVLFGRHFKSERELHCPAWLHTVLDSLRDAPHHPWSLTELAALAGKHPVHLARSFRHWQGCTVGDYVRRMRAERAAELLRNSRKPLPEIAAQCGYGDAAEFSRSFKKVFGLAPSAFRQQAR